MQLGAAALGPVLDRTACQRLLDAVRRDRDFGQLFLAEADYRKSATHVGVNPRPGRNLLGRLDCGFIFDNPVFIETMRRVLGNAWRVLDFKFVVGVPHSWMPQWVVKETNGLAVPNLGAYVRPEYRDMTYFHGIDFHQDIIDFKDRNADFVTVYVYLEDVRTDCSPLHIVPRSHERGATIFPHRLFKTSEGLLRYEDDAGGSDAYECKVLTGEAGSMYYWHALTLHGTQPHADDKPRISVRILAEKNARSDVNCELDCLNRVIKGKLTLIETRKDLDSLGLAVVRGNSINALAQKR